jgi:hypothetical protein
MCGKTKLYRIRNYIFRERDREFFNHVLEDAKHNHKHKTGDLLIVCCIRGAIGVYISCVCVLVAEFGVLMIVRILIMRLLLLKSMRWMNGFI